METGIRFDELNEFYFDFAKIDELYEKDTNAICMKAIKDKKPLKEKEISDKVAEGGELKTYLMQRVFPAKGSGFFVIEKNNIKDKVHYGIEYKAGKQWDQYYEKISMKRKPLANAISKDISKVYTKEVSNGDYAIDHDKCMINIAKQMNYRYKELSEKKTAASMENYKALRSFIKEIICGNVKSHWECMKYFISCLVKRQQSQIILFLCTPGGSGKSTFMLIIEEMLGSAYVKPTNDDVMTGDDKFNDILLGASVVVIEETAGLGKNGKLMKQMKNLSTSDTMVNRQMYQSSQTVASLLNFVVLSNFSNELDIGDRRVFVPSIDSKHTKDTAFFQKLGEQMKDKNAIQLLFNFFFEVDTSQIVLPPDDGIKQDLKLETANAAVRYLLNEYMVRNQYESLEMKMSSAFYAYETFIKENNVKAVCNIALFKADVKHYLSPAKKENGEDKKKDNTLLFDFSIKAMKEMFIKRHQMLTEEKLSELITEYKEKMVLRKEEDEPNYGEVFEMSNLRKQLKEKDEKITELQAQIDELLEQTKEQKKKKVVEEEDDCDEDDDDGKPVWRSFKKNDIDRLLKGFE